jgi:hypothetical protein
MNFDLQSTQATGSTASNEDKDYDYENQRKLIDIQKNSSG